MRILYKTKVISIPQGYTRIEFTEEESDKMLERASGTVLQVGIGRQAEMNRRKFILSVRKVVQAAKQYRVKSIVFDFSDFLFPKISSIPKEEIAAIIGQNLEMANFEFNRFKTKPKEGWRLLENVLIHGTQDRVIKDGIARGIILGRGVNAARELSNMPGGDMTPSILAGEARKAARGLPITVSALRPPALARLNMGGILGVSKGSAEEPRLIVLEYWGAKPTPGKHDRPIAESKNPVVFIGKGVTFDSGGINLKPSDSLLGMHHDMSGGSAVIHTVVLAAKLKLRKNVVGIVPAVENMPSGSSYRPGDVLRSMSGKTIEILNTDAEGRVILADALTFARKYKPTLVIDVATLTGAAMVALGQRASAIFSKDEVLLSRLQKLGEESGDYVWPLPLWEEYEEEVKGTIGDVTNAHNKNSRYGGAINGAVFLYEFAKDLPWVHIDIAPRMTTIQSDRLEPGASGEPVRLLVRLLERGV